MNIKVDFDNIVVKEDKNDFNVKVLMLKGEKGDAGSGEANIIEQVKVNGTALPVTNKAVDVSVPVVDSAISSSSTNPVQNNVIYNALSNKIDASALDNYYEVSEIDSLLSNKVDNTTLESYYPKTQTYSQSETNSLLNNKADVTAINIINTALSTKANASDVANTYETIAGHNNDIDTLTSQISSLASGSPLVASSTSGMTDTTRIYVNSSDGNWYYYNGSSWVSGGVYQSTGIEENSIFLNHLNMDIIGNLFVYNGTKSYAQAEIDYERPSTVTSVKVKGQIYVEEWNKSSSNANLIVRALRRYVPSTGASNSYFDLSTAKTIYVNDCKGKYVDFEYYLNNMTTDQIDAVRFRWNNNSSDLYVKYYLKDIEIYINGTRIMGINCTSTYEGNYTSNISESISYLATKKNVKEITDNLENKINFLQNYDSSTKSNLSKITCWGDSLTEGGSSGTSYPTYLQNLIGNKVTVTNKGSSGECSGLISFRQGGNKVYCNEDFVIPADTTAVSFTMVCSTGNVRNCSHDNSNYAVSINNIEGILDITSIDSSNTFMTGTFTRNTAGTQVNILSGTQILSLQDLYSDDIVIIWVGRNDMAFAWPYQITGVISNIQGMIEHLKPAIKRFLVIGVTKSTNEGSTAIGWIDDLNSKLEELYPYNFIDMNDYLVNQCIYDAGITPTTEDLANISNGLPPLSLMADTVHPNNTARQTYTENVIYPNLLSRGWIIK